MPTQRLKQYYWAWLTAWHRWRHPLWTVYSPHAWLAGLDRHLVPRIAEQANRPIVIVDGGANDGAFARHLYEHFQPACQSVKKPIHVHTFEPNPQLAKPLQANLQGIEGHRETKALAAANQILTFNIHCASMTSSVLKPTGWNARYYPDVIELDHQRQVEAVRLDDWARRQGVEHIDLLKLDLQGYELEALRGATEVLGSAVACIYAEVHFLPFYDGCAMFADIDVLLRRFGYRLFNLYHLASHRRDGQIGSADALFVHESASVLPDVTM